ncbi:MAG: aldose epimerase family protein [Bacilli bacterium]|jgi:aldose 1-epimerase
MDKKHILLTNDSGMEVLLSPLGAALVDISLLLKSGERRSITIAPKKDPGSEYPRDYSGKTIGRNSGRLYNGVFTINGKRYRVIESKSSHGLHGGDQSLAFQTFAAQQGSDENGTWVLFSYLSPASEGGFPGALHVEAHYYLYRGENKLELTYSAHADEDTLCNLTNHVFFNLDGRGTIKDHRLWIDADRFIAVDAEILPKRILPVDEIMDFRSGKAIGQHLANPRLQPSGGYDHPYILNETQPNKPVASLINEKGDVALNLYTSDPALVFYSGNYPTKRKMRNGLVLHKHEELALEPQYVPDAINRDFEQTKTGRLAAGSTYRETIVYEFLTK